MPKRLALPALAGSLLILACCGSQMSATAENGAVANEADRPDDAGPAAPDEAAPPGANVTEAVPPPDAVSHPDGYLPPPADAPPAAEDPPGPDAPPPATEDQYIRNKQSGG